MNFSLLGVPIRVHGAFWLTALLLGFLQYGGRNPLAIAAWVPIVFLAVLLHEMGHALMGRRFGRRPEVHLIAMGGLTTWPAGRQLTHWRSILVSFAGPAVGLVIGGGALAFLLFGPPLGGLALIALQAVVWTNLGWAIFNLVPILPLDGGQILAAALDRFFGMRGQRWARLISVIFACALVAYGLAVGSLFLVILIGMLAWQNYRAWQMEAHWSEGMAIEARARKSEPRAREPEPIDGALRDAWAALEAGDAQKVRRIAEPLVGRARSEEDRYEVGHLVAWGRLLAGDPEGASQALRMLPGGRLPDALLEGAIHLELGRPARAVKPLAEALVGRADDFVATRLARAAAGSARYEDVLALLDDGAKAQAIGPRALQIVVSQAFYAGHLEAAAKVGERLFERFGQASDAFNVACALGKAGRSGDALGWLERAIDAGLPDPTVLDRDADLAPLRALPDFEALRVKAGLAS